MRTRKGYVRMRMLRFYCPELRAGRMPLDSSESHHGIHVLRIKAGSEIEVFDGKGRSAPAVVTEITKKEVVVEVQAIEEVPLLKPRIILAMSLAKGGRFDLAVEKCTELGADHICAVHFGRTVKMGKQEALERYQRIAVAAAKQCGRSRLPALSGPKPLDKTIVDLKTLYPDALCLYGGFGPQAITFGEFHTSNISNQDIICLVGPEGGLTEEETQLLHNEGCREININPHILRTETAAIAFAALLATLKRQP